VQVEVVPGLEQHVAELGVADAVLAGEPGPDRLAGHHLVDRDVLAHVPEEVEHAEVGRPVPVVDQDRPAVVEVDDPGDLGLDRRHVGAERGVVEQVALLGPPARVADHPGRAAGERHGAVAGVLEPAQHQEADQVADVQAVGAGIAAVVDRQRSLGQAGGERGAVGAVLHQAAGLEVIEKGP
jgi:hypothetical protein